MAAAGPSWARASAEILARRRWGGGGASGPSGVSDRAWPGTGVTERRRRRPGRPASAAVAASSIPSGSESPLAKSDVRGRPRFGADVAARRCRRTGGAALSAGSSSSSSSKSPSLKPWRTAEVSARWRGGGPGRTGRSRRAGRCSAAGILGCGMSCVSHSHSRWPGCQVASKSSKSRCCSGAAAAGGARGQATVAEGRDRAPPRAG